jgi:alpha-tubulin suppressor-like RCC1 family protein
MEFTAGFTLVGGGTFVAPPPPPPPPPPQYLWAWGRNDTGQLGLGNTTNYSSPKQVGALGTWSKIAVGPQHRAAIKTDGTMWAWGWGSSGRLGLGDTTTRNSPVQIGTLTTWSSIAIGSTAHNLAIKTDGTLWSWGDNDEGGALGLGDLTARSSPVQIGALTTWSTITGGALHSLAVKTDGTLWSWGKNLYTGVLGLGNTTNYSSPKQVGALTNWSKINAYNYHNLAIKTDGTMWSWGNGGYGRLGLSNTTYRSSPVQIGALTTWLSISAGVYQGFAIKTDGTMWAWGKNGSAELGLNDTANRSSPTQIGALTTWSFISGGDASCTAIKTDGTMWTWGYNAQGRLGLGDTTDRSSPVQIGALTTWSSVDTAGFGALAISN